MINKLRRIGFSEDEIRLFHPDEAQRTMKAFKGMLGKRKSFDKCRLERAYD